ncbi:hypothetical protein BJ165DRAFT_1594709 [Panaeolus papilionaceus]|nr:hypothetical protein BJ165DRAFT_1594709 [Panaeolus papilionaceus]
MATPPSKYTNLTITGPLSIVSRKPEDYRRKEIALIMLLGPTGSGKSSFVEALSPDQQLLISKDQLDAVTQNVSLYSVANLKHSNRPVVIMDTPGFLDGRISESAILGMNSQMLDALRASTRSVTVSVFYFQPISYIRIGGAKRDCIKLLIQYIQKLGLTRCAVLSTMWNHMKTPRHLGNANLRFDELGDLVSISSNINVELTKFLFSKESALSSIDKASPELYHGEKVAQAVNIEYHTMLRSNLLDRIANLQQELVMLTEDKCHVLTPGKEDPHLLSVVYWRTQEAMQRLQSFYNDLYLLDPEGCRSLLGMAPIPVVPRLSRPRTIETLGLVESFAVMGLPTASRRQEPTGDKFHDRAHAQILWEYSGPGIF